MRRNTSFWSNSILRAASRWTHLAVLLAFAFVFVACSSVPKEAPTLSAELGKQLRELEASHLRLAEAYFAEKRSQIDAFLYDEWVPVFAEELFDQPAIQETWNQVVASDDPQDRVRFIQILGPRIQQKIAQKREELVTPINEAERLVKGRIQRSYEEAKSTNGAITSFLASASEVEENRVRYMEMFGVSEDALSGTIETVDAAVGSLVKGRGTAEELLEQGQAYRRQMSNVLSGL